MDLDPDNLAKVRCLSSLDKLRFAYSIIDIYSIIEELGLEIRANAQKPSIINNVWNDLVLSDLMHRLQDSNINPNKLIPWLSRKGKIRPFKAAVIDSAQLCPWSDCESVFDFEISIKDAILELGFQRNKLASHCVGERVAELDIIDLENAFSLLRTIFLDYFEVNIVFE